MFNRPILNYNVTDNNTLDFNNPNEVNANAQAAETVSDMQNTVASSVGKALAGLNGQNNGNQGVQGVQPVNNAQSGWKRQQ